MELSPDITCVPLRSLLDLFNPTSVLFVEHRAVDRNQKLQHMAYYSGQTFKSPCYHMQIASSSPPDLFNIPVHPTSQLSLLVAGNKEYSQEQEPALLHVKLVFYSGSSKKFQWVVRTKPNKYLRVGNWEVRRMMLGVWTF